MNIGTLTLVPATEHPELVAKPVTDALAALGESAKDVHVAAIDPEFADSAAFCEKYEVAPEIGANCVILEAKRGDKKWLAVCLVLIPNRADINGVIRRHLDARRVSFASMERAVEESGMEYGGITPIGLPAEWPILIDPDVAKLDHVIIGSGIRGSKILTTGAVLTQLPNAVVVVDMILKKES